MHYVEISANEQMTVKKFCDEIKKLHKKYFPKFNFSIEYSNNVKFLVNMILAVKDIHEFSKIEPLHVNILITNKDEKPIKCQDIKTCSMPNDLVLKIGINEFLTKSDQEFTLDKHKFSIRKVTGNVEKILSAIDKYFKTIKTDIEKLLDDDKIHHFHTDLIKERL